MSNMNYSICFGYMNSQWICFQWLQEQSMPGRLLRQKRKTKFNKGIGTLTKWAPLSECIWASKITLSAQNNMTLFIAFQKLIHHSE